MYQNRKLNTNYLELNCVLCYASLGSSAPRTPGYGCYRHHYGSVLHQQAGGCQSSPYLSSIGSIPVAAVIGHGSLGQTLSSCLRVIVSRLSRPSQPIPTEWSLCLRNVGSSHAGHVRHSPQHSASPLHVSILEPQALPLDALSKAWQGQSMYMFLRSPY